MAKHNEFGRFGEQRSADYLRDNGYEILAQNYRYLNAEIDIVAKKEGILAIVEVKARNMGFLEDISNTINSKKIKLLTLAAHQFIVEHNLNLEVRFDVITVIKTEKKIKIQHLENAFYYF